MKTKSKKPRLKPDDSARKLARKIAISLFTNGEGKRAERLQLKMLKRRAIPISGETDGGGWGFEFAMDDIARVIEAHNAQLSRESGEAVG